VAKRKKTKPKPDPRTVELVEELNEALRKSGRGPDRFGRSQDENPKHGEELDQLLFESRILLKGREKQLKKKHRELKRAEKKMSFLTTSEIAPHARMSIQEFELLLERLGWTTRLGRGWNLTPKGRALGARVQRKRTPRADKMFIHQVEWPSDILLNKELENALEAGSTMVRKTLLLVGGDRRESGAILKHWDIDLTHWQQGREGMRPIPDGIEAVIIWTRHVDSDANKSATKRAKSQGVALRRVTSHPTLELALSELGYPRKESDENAIRALKREEEELKDLDLTSEREQDLLVENIPPSSSASFEELFDRMQAHLKDMGDSAQLFIEAHEAAEETFEEIKVGLAMMDAEKRTIETERDRIKQAKKLLEGVVG